MTYDSQKNAVQFHDPGPWISAESIRQAADLVARARPRVGVAAPDPEDSKLLRAIDGTLDDIAETLDDIRDLLAGQSDMLSRVLKVPQSPCEAGAAEETLP